MIVGYYKNYLYTTDIRSALKKKRKKNNNNKESQYMVSHPETGSDSPIESDRDWGRDIACWHFQKTRCGFKLADTFTIPNAALSLLEFS